MRAAPAILLLMLPALARAEVKVDWAAGLVTSTGIGLADRQAPNPAVARGPSRRRAEEAARQALATSVPDLPLAAGGTVKDKLGDKAIQERIDRAIAAASMVSADPETDGSWHVTMAVPLEAVRQAITGPRVLGPAPGDKDVPVVIVDGVSAKPALGYTFGGITGASVWVKDVPAWAKDAPRIKEKSTKAGAIELATAKGGAATLFMIVTK